VNEESQIDEPLRPVLDMADADVLSESGDFYSKTVRYLGWAIILIALICSAVAFAGYVENDKGFMHLLSAFGLCFGIGALVYIPFGLIANYAKNAIHKPLPRYRSVIVLLLVLPWFPLAFYLFRLGGGLRIFSILALACAVYISLWAIRFLRSK